MFFLFQAIVMTAIIAGIQVGNIRTEGDPASGDSMTRQWTTAFYKFPVLGPVRILKLGLEGDAVADKRFHGGIDKAVLGYSAENYAKWWSELSPGDFVEQSIPLQFGPGGFAENLTIAGQDESQVCIGDRYQIGRQQADAVLLEISQPRQPCWKISRRWQHKTLTKLVATSGRTGWYFRVLREGVAGAGDVMTLLDRPHPQWTVARANDVLLGRESDRYAVAELIGLDVLATDWKKSLA